MLYILHHLLDRFKKGVLVSSRINRCSYGPLDSYITSTQTSVIKFFLENLKAFRNGQEKKHRNK